MNDADTFTYIIRTQKEEFYCGKTKNYKIRMKQHKIEKKGWFAIRKSRKIFTGFIIFKGDYEKQIKRAGVRLIFELFFNSIKNEKEVSAS